MTKTTRKHKVSYIMQRQIKEDIKEKYQIEKASFPPGALIVITFVNRPPVKSCTHKVIISFGYGGNSLNGNFDLFC